MSRKIRFPHPYMEATAVAINDLNDRISGGHVFKASEGLVNPDELFSNPERIYVKNPDSPNLPLAAPLYLAVDVAVDPGCDCAACACPCPPTEVIGVTQTVWDDPAGDVWRRLGTVTEVEGQEPQVQWGQWSQLGTTGGGTCDCQRRRLTGQIEFYIRKDGNDDTGDGLSEATALATWEGYIKRYVTGPDSFDANFNQVTINFGPGHWEGNYVFLGHYFRNPEKVIINGAGIDQTIFGTPTGDTISVSQPCQGRYVFQNFTLENYKRGIYVAYNGEVAIQNLKFKNGLSDGTSYCVYLVYNSVVSMPTGATLYLENFRGISPFYSSFGSIMALQCNIAISGTCSWSHGFVHSVYQGAVRLHNFSSQGTGTGRKYNVSTLGLIMAAAGNQNLLPGSIAGVTATGGIYV